MDCPQIDLATDRSDTMRWLLRDEGGKLATKSEQRWSSYAYEMHKLLNAADGRLRELLQFKRARECPPRATALPGTDDLALLRELESVQSQIDAGNGEEAGLLAERTRLLDGLRIVPAPVTAPTEGISPAPLQNKKAPGRD